MKKKGSIIYVYVGLFLSAILIILIGNSYFLIDRTRSNLIEIYWKQGELIVKSIAVSAHQAIDSVKLSPIQIRRHLKRLAEKLDSDDYEAGGLSEDDIKEYLITEDLQAISILDENNNTKISVSISSLNNTTNQDQNDQSELLPKSVKIERDKEKGFILFTLSPKKLLGIKTEIGLKLLIASLENRNVVEYISFIDEHFKIVADSDPNKIGGTEEEMEYLDAIRSGVSYFFRDSNENSMKVIHPLEFTSATRGVLKVSYPITRIDAIYENTFKNTILNSSVVMILAIFAAIIAVKINRRNLVKIESMEKKIRENEKLESLSILTAGVAHEVRNPLNSVSITIQRLQLEFSPKNEEDQEEYETLTDLMKREVDRINLIITDFLDFAKPFEPKKTVFQINDFIENVLAIIQPETNEQGIKLISNIHADNQQFNGDYEKLTQVLINLLHNSMEASQANQTITIESIISKKKSWLLKITDNGVGIPKQNLNHIFDIYFTTKKNGTGLGLYICRKIINAHDGSIELQPNIGNGITVSVNLPFLSY